MVCVLLVEDEREIAELARDALSEAGFSVTVALDDQSASRTLEREARSFAALVTDINLGAGVTGFDLARRARGLMHRAPLISKIFGITPPRKWSMPVPLPASRPFTVRSVISPTAPPAKPNSATHS